MLKALAEPQRIAVLRLVHAQELPAGEIAAHFKTSRQAISQHLKLMTDAGLLELRRDGTRRLYRIRQQGFGDLRTFLDIFWGGGSHNSAHGNAELPEELTWLWRDYEPGKTEQVYQMDPAEKSKPMLRVKIYSR